VRGIPVEHDRDTLAFGRQVRGFRTLCRVPATAVLLRSMNRERLRRRILRRLPHSPVAWVFIISTSVSFYVSSRILTSRILGPTSCINLRLTRVSHYVSTLTPCEKAPILHGLTASEGRASRGHGDGQ
jgi:hypothetical protein